MCTSKSILKPLLIGAGVRGFLFLSNYAVNLQNRIDIATPINSWKRVKEGVYLFENDVNPYLGDIYHENPILLLMTRFLINNLENFIPAIFILIDLLSSILLKKAFTVFVIEQYTKQKITAKAKNIEELLLTQDDLEKIPYYVAVAYLLNPYSILNCVGQTTTVWSNFLLAATFYFLAKKNVLLATTTLALETQKNLYPFVLIVPIALYVSQGNKNQKFIFGRIILLFMVIFLGLNYLSFKIVKDWSFIDATYVFILSHRDFQPNIGLFWYFFMEMFDHFRTLFLFTFQMNATILYLFPLTFKLKDEPIMLATILTALNAIFRSYPCIGDVAFYLALLPLWKKASKFMTHNFIVTCFFVVTSVLGPTVYYLWIYLKSANANFFFGVSLAFSTAQIFLVTDLLFAFTKREFCLENGMKFKIDGKEAKMALE